MSRKIGHEFEQEVRRIARIRWPSASFDGATIAQDRERDGVFETEDVVHVVECTISRTKDKARDDIRKTATLVSKLRKINNIKAVRGWFVTLYEPTAEQRKVADKYKSSVVICSFDQFRSELVDAPTYLQLRIRCPFGSIWNMSDNSPNVGREEYVDIDLLEANNDGDQSIERKIWPIREIANEMTSSGKNFILTGDFGVGKSMTLREIFYKLRHGFYKKKTPKFPIFLNLRNHHGQTHPDEALERHARWVGYPNPTHLVRAWRAGDAFLILDGFDEMASAGWVGEPEKLRQIRFKTMTLVREFVRQTPKDGGIVLSGRSHYFDSKEELQSALGVEGGFIELNLNEFTEEQIRKYFDKKGVVGDAPDWLPTRPLLVGYLVAHGLFDESLRLESMTPVEGWDLLLTGICDREAQIEINIDGGAVRELVERLATKGRQRQIGLGPLLADEINTTFREVVGHPPDEKAQVLLLRLPGLGPPAPEDSSRSFIDEDLADAARAGDIVRFSQYPFHFDAEHLIPSQSIVGDLGISVGALQCRARGISCGNLSSALEAAGNIQNGGILSIDVMNLMKELGCAHNGAQVVIRDTFFDEMHLGEDVPNLSKIYFEECGITRLYLDPNRLLKISGG